MLDVLTPKVLTNHLVINYIKKLGINLSPLNKIFRVKSHRHNFRSIYYMVYFISHISVGSTTNGFKLKIQQIEPPKGADF